MITCGVCRQALRADESLRHLQTHGNRLNANAHQYLVSVWGNVPDETIGAAACERCYATLTGTEVPPVRTYPPGSRVPKRSSGGGDIDICGLCRRAMYEDDEHQDMRLHSEDLVDELWDKYQEAMATHGRDLQAIRVAAERDYAIAVTPHDLTRDTLFAQVTAERQSQLHKVII